MFLSTTAIAAIPRGTYTPPAAVASLVLSPSALSVAAGASAALTATPCDARLNALNGRAITWASSNPAVASVAGGVVTGVAAGSATITATCEGVSATCAVTSTAAAAFTTIADLGIVRFDGVSAPSSVSVSNAIPLPPSGQPGAVTAAQVSRLRLQVAGADVPVAFTVLANTTRPDGTLRTLLVQFDQVVGGTPVAAVLALGTGTRPVADLAPRAAQPVPVAAALPTSVAYLLSTQATGPVLSAPATSGTLATLESYAVQAEAATFANYGIQYGGGSGAQYGRARWLFQQFLRTANPTWFRRACQVTNDYVTNYVYPNAARIPPWWIMPDWLTPHYLLTGDDRSRQMIRRLAVGLWAYYGVQELGNVPNEGDDRLRARKLQTQLEAATLGLYSPVTTTVPQPDIEDADNQYFHAPSDLDASIAQLLGTQGTTANGTGVSRPGMWGGYYTSTRQVGAGSSRDSNNNAPVPSGPITGPGQKNYMAGMLNTALCRYADERSLAGSALATILAAVKASCDDLWDYERRTTWSNPNNNIPDTPCLGFSYITVNIPGDSGGGPSNLPTLNTICAHAFAWIAARHPDAVVRATYRDRTDQLLAGAVTAIAQIDDTAIRIGGKNGYELVERLPDTIALRLQSA